MFRGSLADVAARALACCEMHGFDRFARICGDRPFLPWELLDELIATAEQDDLDLASNAVDKTYPQGQRQRSSQRARCGACLSALRIERTASISRATSTQIRRIFALATSARANRAGSGSISPSMTGPTSSAQNGFWRGSGLGPSAHRSNK